MSRSYLFIPGNSPAMVQNLDVFDADAVILDLEDSVLYHDKDAARELVFQFLNAYPQKIDIYVRINGEETEHFVDDVEALNRLPIKGYVLPKALTNTVDMLSELTDKDIIAIIESPAAYLQATMIASRTQVKALLLGAEDYTKEMNIERSIEGTEIFHIRSHIAIVCRAFNIDSIDTPFTQKDVSEDLIKDCIKAKRLGFTSKSAIHPNHVETINTIFAPSEEEIYQAQRIVTKAEQEQKGAFSLDGKMIDAPIIEKAKKTIEKAKKYNLL